jgi:hypothetical protein
MLITSFNRPLVIRVSDERSSSAEEIIRKWISEGKKTRNHLYLNKMYDEVFPMKFPELYIISMGWSIPCRIFSNPYKPERYFWLIVNTTDSLDDLDNILRLQYRSTLKNETVENEKLVMEQLLNRNEFITIKTL